MTAIEEQFDTLHARAILLGYRLRYGQLPMHRISEHQFFYGWSPASWRAELELNLSMGEQYEWSAHEPEDLIELIDARLTQLEATR